MKINKNMPREQVLDAVIWVEGLEVPPYELVSVDGNTYMNMQEEGFNTEDPLLEGSGYSKSLKGVALISALMDVALKQRGISNGK